MSTFKILCIGDPHIKSDNSLETDLMICRIEEIITIQNPNIIIVLGDTLHYHERIPMYTLKRATHFFKMLKNTKKNVYILIGNHDRPNNNIFLTDEHAFNSFKEWENMTIIDDVTVISENFENHQYNFLMVPYVPVGRFNEALATKSLAHPLTTISAVFCHQEWDGCKINLISGCIADIWPLDAPLNISGHIHDYEIVQNNLRYPGTPIQHSPSDTTNKTVSIIEMKRSENSEVLSFHYENRISLNIPHKISITLTPDELLTFVLPELFSSIRIKIECSSSVYKGLMELVEVKKLAGTFGVKIIHINIDLFKTPKYGLGSSTEDILVSYEQRLKLTISQYPNNIMELHKYFSSLEI